MRDIEDRLRSFLVRFGCLFDCLLYLLYQITFMIFTFPSCFFLYARILLGTTFVSATTELLPVIAASADDAFQFHPETVIANAIDGIEDTNYKSCYIANQRHKGWAHLTIPLSDVTRVELLNRDDTFC